MLQAPSSSTLIACVIDERFAPCAACLLACLPAWPFSPPAGVCNTACFLASRLGRTEVTQADLVAAVEQAKYGRVYEAGRFISPGRKQRFAVVESGYCLAAALLPAIEPIDYVTILPSIKSPVGRTVLKVRKKGVREGERDTHTYTHTDRSLS